MIKIGTIGTGTIVENFLKAIAPINDVQGTAVYSRNEDTGNQLAQKFGIPRVYTHLDEMLDSDIDFVYVASPNSLHFEHSLRALKKGKNVLCEKPFTSTLNETEVLIETARNNNLFLFEAITTIHLPNFQQVKQHIPLLGDIKIVQCNFSQYSKRYDLLKAGETPNVFNPLYSGGALQDINIYNLHFVMNIFGPPQHLNYFANKHANGIDTSGILILKYPGFMCECVGAKDSGSRNFALIQGDNGYIAVESEVSRCLKVKLVTTSEERTINEQEISDNPLYYEMLAFTDLFNKKDYTTCYKLLDYSHSVMRALTHARKDAGIVFEADRRV